MILNGISVGKFDRPRTTQRLGAVKRLGSYSDSFSPRWSRRSSDWDLPLPSFRRNRRGGYGGGGMYSSLSFNR